MHQQLHLPKLFSLRCSGNLRSDTRVACTQSVIQEGVASACCEVRYWVPQGTILVPLAT